MSDSNSNNPTEFTGFEPVRDLPKNIEAFLRFFKWDHLPPKLQEVSAPFHRIATDVAISYRCAVDEPDGAETMVGLRKLLEAKDCVVRSRLPR